MGQQPRKGRELAAELTGMWKSTPRPRDQKPEPGARAAKWSTLFDDALFDGEAEEFGIVGEAEVLHDAVFVKGDGAGGDVEDGGGFFHGVAFGEELQDFALARRQNSAHLRATWLACG